MENKDKRGRMGGLWVLAGLSEERYMFAESEERFVSGSVRTGIT